MYLNVSENCFHFRFRFQDEFQWTLKSFFIRISTNSQIFLLLLSTNWATNPIKVNAGRNLL